MLLKPRLLLLLKPFSFSPEQPLLSLSSSSDDRRRKAFGFLRERNRVHKNAVNRCLDILKRKAVRPVVSFRSEIARPIRHDDVDLVVTIGGDGTLLHASHFMDDSVPLLGVNSDPTIPQEVESYIDEFDATRSTGYLCAATADTFEQTLDTILENRSEPPSELTRIAVNIRSKLISTSALNDVLLTHPCPAAASRFSFRIIAENGKPCTSLLHSRSSGLRVSTATGSTAAMLSAGGSAMPILSKELQYMVREPILPGPSSPLMHGFVKDDETMDVMWSCGDDGALYVDGSNVVHSVQLGDSIRFSSTAPKLKMYLPPHLLLSRNGFSELCGE